MQKSKWIMYITIKLTNDVAVISLILILSKFRVIEFIVFCSIQSISLCREEFKVVGIFNKSLFR